MARKSSNGTGFKDGKAEILPSRLALAQLTGGDPAQRSLSNYAQLTPDGLNDQSQTIQTMGKRK